MKKNILIFILILFISVGFIFILNKSQDDTNLSKEAFAAIKINGKYGLIDTKGNIVIAPIYDFAGNFLIEINTKKKTRIN